MPVGSSFLFFMAAHDETSFDHLSKGPSSYCHLARAINRKETARKKTTGGWLVFTFPSTGQPLCCLLLGNRRLVFPYLIARGGERYDKREETKEWKRHDPSSTKEEKEISERMDQETDRPLVRE